MSPPLPVTEDTPPDMLAGAMDLQVVLPNGQQKKMSVERSTPMMDLLVQITTKNKISPGGHFIQAIGDRGILPYKPSTPIGALDTWTVHVMPKKQASNAYYKKTPCSLKPANINTPFEQTFRLQVNLPRNQLYVTRVSYKTRLEDILREVCVEKNLDQSKYCLVNPENPSEELDLSCTFLQCKLQRITLLSKNNRPVGLSSVDIMALKRYENGSQRINNNYASHSYDGSISSGSLEGRSLSPVRSDESSCSPTIPKTNGIANSRPIRKRRPAPKPPSNTTNGSTEKKTTSETLTISHSRNSSDSSGYHESSVLSESPESNVNRCDWLSAENQPLIGTQSIISNSPNCIPSVSVYSLPDSLPRRSKLPSNDDTKSTTTTTVLRNGKIGGCLSRSLSNLAVVEDGQKPTKTFFANGIKSKAYSASSTSLASCGGKRKKAPAPPPPSSKSLLSLKEEDAPLNDLHHNNGHSSSSSCSGISNDTPYRKSQTLPAGISLPSVTDDDDDTQTPATNDDRLAAMTPDSTTPGFSSNTVDCRSSDHFHSRKPSLVDTLDSVAEVGPAAGSAAKNESVEHELTMDDDEIDRIFDDATKCCECSPSSTALSLSAESIYNAPKDDKRVEDDSAYNWQYKLPSPTKEIRRLTSNDSSVVKVDNLASKNTAANNSGEKRLLMGKADTKDVESFRFRVDSGCSSKAEDEDLSSSSASSTLSKRTAPAGKAAPSAAALTSNYDSNFTSSSTNNDSGLGSDDSIPSIAEQPAKAAAAPVSVKTKLSQPCRRRGSNLENFCITTYQNTKPMEIFHDDSVKTAKTTQLAKNSHPAFGKTPEERSEGALPARRGSFRAEKSTTAGCSIKRSKSHISVLSGNYARFNKYGKLTTAAKKRYDDGIATDAESSTSCDNLPSAYDDCKSAKYKSLPSTMASQLRKSSSEFTVNKDTNKEEDELLELRDQVVKWKENEKINCFKDTNAARVRNSAELQSLQILKDILPQINKSQMRNNRESVSAGHLLSCESRAKIESKRELPTVADRVPAVNLQSWNDRPKRQVSIKTDRDYIYGGSKKSSCGNNNETVLETSLHSGSDNMCENRLTMRANGDYADGESSRVPVVRAVEFKKPFVERSTPVGLQHSNTRNVSMVDDAAKRARPNSCYLFGERLSTYNGETDSRNGDAARSRQTMPDTRRLANNRPKGVFTLRTYNEQMAEREENRRHPRQREADLVRVEDWHRKRATIAATLELRETSTASPPPPALPMASLVSNLKPVTNRRTTSCSKLPTDENTRDILLFSIKNFNRDNLRKLRVK